MALLRFFALRGIEGDGALRLCRCEATCLCGPTAPLSWVLGSNKECLVAFFDIGLRVRFYPESWRLPVVFIDIHPSGGGGRG